MQHYRFFIPTVMYEFSSPVLSVNDNVGYVRVGDVQLDVTYS